MGYGKKIARGFLRMAFATALAAGIAEGYVALDDAAQADRGIPLTEGERALVSGIFGDQIRTDKIRKYYRFSKDIGNAGTVKTGSHTQVTFWNQNNHAEDYSKERGWKLHVFAHELTHIWQNQNMPTLLKFLKPPCEQYDYTLTDQSRFDDFCEEQQAEIIGHYTSFFLHPANPSAFAESYGRNLLRVVEEKFPQAQKTWQNLKCNTKK